MKEMFGFLERFYRKEKNSYCRFVWKKLDFDKIRDLSRKIGFEDKEFLGI